MRKCARFDMNLCWDFINEAGPTRRPDSFPRRCGGTQFYAGSRQTRHFTVGVEPYRASVGDQSRPAPADPRNVAPTEAGERLVETLRPAFDDIESELAALTQLREKPSGTTRITTSEHAANTILWPVVKRLLRDYPDLNIELSIDQSLTDIVEGRFDAGVRLGENLAKDMIAVPIGPDIRMAAFAAPAYLDRHGAPQSPHELTDHKCINLRLPTLGGLYAWEFEKDGHELRVRVDGQLILNDVPLILQAAKEGFGLGCVPEDHVLPLIRDGNLVRVLEDWCPPFAGYHLYYPSRRQPSSAFTLFVDALRYRR
jgi:DNA-binding transcriptional LysR family regulator